MNESDVRAELDARGLTTYGYLNALRARLDNYDTRGELKGNLAAMSDHHLQNACNILSIDSNGERCQLVERIKVYNAQKRKRMGKKEDPGEINAGLPTPDDRLGEPMGERTRKKILGTRGSGICSKSYSLYLDEFEDKYKTTENAWTLRFFRSFMNPDIPPEELWPPRYHDCRIIPSDDADVQCVKESYASILKY